MDQKLGFETILDNSLAKEANQSVSELDCVDCFDCDYNCEECDSRRE